MPSSGANQENLCTEELKIAYIKKRFENIDEKDLKEGNTPNHNHTAKEPN
jgi:hypothetical protein